jgi:hypothetical protein
LKEWEALPLQIKRCTKANGRKVLPTGSASFNSPTGQHIEGSG